MMFQKQAPSAQGSLRAHFPPRLPWAPGRSVMTYDRTGRTAGARPLALEDGEDRSARGARGDAVRDDSIPGVKGTVGLAF